MAKQLNIDVNLNTARASAQLKGLQQELTAAINGAGNKGMLTQEIVKATEAAINLKAILDSSMNSKGNLDLSRFSQNLAKSKMDLTGYAKQLNNLGSEGQKAFASMAKQIVTAQAPIRETGTLTTKLFTTLKNTARWQLSSAALHQFVGGLQSALSYARGLDSSLNSIRIVSGQTADQMSKFAESANKSAKALSASTLDYTDAALIYYQQGIRDEAQIKARTDATIKMANVTKQSAAQVSEQLTAIWNNFADGSTNLEYYADVITALGASTASSSAEISKGLEKFAAVADTVGLSYEYATSALATIVATTRQSADTVGTALKTLFARIQDLELGKTLDDGTTLGKYSKALDAVGISIKDANGEVKNMDIILDEMGSKWKTLSKDMQIALAQSVAGTRQYTQLVALMDNWDFMKQNLQTAYSATGALQKQADIYAESWDAARNRVKAAAQGIYDDLISDKFFIKFNDGIATVLSGINKFVDALGGIPGTLGLISAVGIKLFNNQFVSSIDRAIQSVKVFTGIAAKEASQVRDQATVAMQSITHPMDSPKSMIMQSNYLTTGINLANQYQKKLEEIAKAGGQVSNIDKARIQMLQEIASLHSEAAVAAQQELEASEESLLTLQRRIAGNAEQRYINTHPSQERAKLIENAQAAGIRQANEAKALSQFYSYALSGPEGLKNALQGYVPSSFQEKGIQYLLRKNTAQARILYKDALEGNTPLGQQLIITNKDNKRLISAEVNKLLMTPQGREELSQMSIRGLKKAGFDPRTGKQAAVDTMYKQLQEQTKDAQANLKNAEAMRNYGKDIQHYAKAIDERNRIEKSGGELSETKKAFAKLSEDRLKAIANSINGKQMAKDFETQIRAAFRGKDSKFADELIESSRARVEKDNKVNIQSQNADKQNAVLAQNIKALEKQSFSGLASGIAQAASGVATLSIGLSSLKSAIDAINDSSLSFGEKFLQVSMSMGMGISMLLSSIGSLTKGFSTIGNGIISLVTSAAAATGGFSAEEFAAMSLTDKLRVLAMAKLDAAKASTGQTAGEAAATAGMEAEATAARGLKFALMDLLAPIAAIIAIVAVIASIVKVTKEAQEMSPEGQLKSAQENATNMQNALEQTKTAADNLKASFDNYGSIQSRLSACAKGTQEWTEALRENNNEVLNLLAQYPELAGMEGAIQKNADGVLTISKSAQEALIKKSQEDITDATWAAAYASQDVIKKQQAVNQNNLIKQWNDIARPEQITTTYDGFSGNYLKEITDLQSKQVVDVVEGQRKTLVDYMLDNPMGEDLKKRWNALQNSTPIQSWRTARQDPEIEQMKQRINQTLDIANTTANTASNLMLNNNGQAAVGIRNAREDLKYSPNQGEYTKVVDALGMSLSYTGESYQERRMGGTAGFLDEVSDAKSKGLNIIASHWGELMTLTAEEMGPTLDKIFTGSGVSMRDSAAWAKELTSNNDLRKALNQNATSAMAAATTQAAIEASSINEKLVAEGYSKKNAEQISKIMGQSGQLSYATSMEESRILGTLRSKVANKEDLYKQYVESKGGLTSSITKTKGGITFQDAQGNEYTATNEMMASALAAAAALDQLAGSASGVAEFISGIDTSTTEGQAMLDYLQDKSFLGMKPEEVAEFAGGITSAADMEKFFKDNGITEDNVKELLGVDTVAKAAEEAYGTLSLNNEGLVEALSQLTDEQRAQLEGLRTYKDMTSADQIDYINKHFNKELFNIPQLDESVESYSSLASRVDEIRGNWDAVGNSIQNGVHVTEDMNNLFDSLGMNIGDLGEFIEGDLIVDAEGLKQALGEAGEEIKNLIDHAMQMDMITYDNLTEDLLRLVSNTDDATRATDEYGRSLENILSQMDGLELSMAKLGQLKESLTGSTSLFEAFDTAQSVDAAADWTDEWTKALKDMNSLIQSGETGGEAWKTGQQLLLPEELQGANRKQTQNYISSLVSRGLLTSTGKGEYDVTQQNAVNFLKELDKADLITGDINGDFHLAENVTSIKQMADALNLSETAATALFSKLALMSDDGNELWAELARNAGDFGTQILTQEEEIGNLGKKLDEARQAGDWDTYETLKEQIEAAGIELDNLKEKASQKVDFQFGLKTEIEETENAIKDAEQKVEDLKKKAAENPDNYPLQQELAKAEDELSKLKQKWAELTGQIEDMSEFEIKVNLEESYDKLQKLRKQIDELHEVARRDPVTGKVTSHNLVDDKGSALVDQYGHRITSKSGAKAYADSIEQSINVKVTATGSEQVFQDIKQRWAEANGEISNNPAKLDIDDFKARMAIKKAWLEAKAFANGKYEAKLTAADNTSAGIASALASLRRFAQQKAAILNGDGDFQGSANVFGSAYDRGSWGLKSAQTNALVGELGQELIVDPKTGKYQTVGDSGAEFVNIPKGAIIFNHRQTEQLLKYRRINTRGQAYLEGNAFASIDNSLNDTSNNSNNGNNSGGNNNNNNNNNNKKKNGGTATAADGEILTYEQNLLKILREEVDEYSELERAVTRLEHAYKNFTRNNDRLWGQALLDNIQNSINKGKQLYEREYALMKAKQDEYKRSIERLSSTTELQYTKQVYAGGTYDKDAKFNTVRVSFDDFNIVDFLTGQGYLDNKYVTRDANGNVSDIDTVMFQTALVEYFNTQQKLANQMVEDNHGEETKVEAENMMNNVNAIYELGMNFYKDLTSAETEMLDQEEKTQDILEEIHDLAAQKIVKQLEMRNQLLENEQKLVDLTMKRIGDGLYHQAEKFLTLFDLDLFDQKPIGQGDDIFGRDVQKMQNFYDSYLQANNGLALGRKDPHDKDAIDLEQWQSITQTAFDGIIDSLEDMIDKRNELEAMFGETADMAIDEITKLTDRMDSTISQLDHIQNLLELTGRKLDFAAKETIIRGSMHNLKNAWQEASYWAESMTKQREAAEEEYNNLLLTDAKGAAMFKEKVLDKSIEMENDAIEKMYSSAEAFMEKVNELWETKVNEISQQWEKIATAGQGWDYLSGAMSRAKSIQDEYLTTTNKLYETNTLMRKLNQDIDKTDSSVRKEKLKDFYKEVENAQNMNRLNKSSMDILKARYEILQAEMALEDAKNAKSTVRLQRDSEGNYGYVYTADENKVNEAEQNLADKQNDLYNLVLEQQNNAQEQRLQIQQEYHARAAELWNAYQNGEIASQEEYEAKMTELYNQCYDKLIAIDTTASESAYWLNQVAAEGSSEAWAQSFANRITDTETYMEAFRDSNSEIEETLDEVNTIRDEVTKDAKLGLDDVTKKTEELTTANDMLTQQLHTTEQAAASELLAVSNLTAVLADQYTELDALIQEWQAYAEAMQAAMVAAGPEQAAPAYSGDKSSGYLHSLASGQVDNGWLIAREGAMVGMEQYTDKGGGYLQGNQSLINFGKVAIDELGMSGDEATSAWTRVATIGAQQGASVMTEDEIRQLLDPKEKKWVKQSMASGGYTGEWGNSGKLAILHEKELVLNAEDTSNLLDTIQLLRSITSQIDLRSSLSNLIASIVAPSLTTMNSESLQQEVTIHAEFPNVSEKNEIEEAFKSLINQASQYANRY